MKFKFAYILILLLISSVVLAQDKSISGTVSFVTSNNVYVKFDDTRDIEIGKSLLLAGTDCLRVTDKSSTSVVSVVLNNCAVKTGVVVTYIIVVTEIEPGTEPSITEPDDEVLPAEVIVPTTLDTEKESIYTENIRGRVSLASYNTFSDLREDRHQFRTRFSLNANHLGDSKFSIESYLTYRNIITPADSRYNGRTNIFNIYNLNVRYDATPSLSVTAGRKINQKASTVGAIDGVQVEKYFGNFYVGAMGGYRPDFQDYGFNSDLLQYGGYFGIQSNSQDFYSETTLGAMEQTNSGATDRRYIFFQHFSTIASDLSLFGSAEMDIFGNTGNETRLTNLYLSARYRISRAANIMVSYDSRKRIIYYETFQTEIEQLLNDDLARQGFRTRINVRPAKILWLGLSYSRRFRSDNQNKSDNFYAYATVSRIPHLGGRINISYNMNSSNYLSSNIYSIRYSREFFENKLGTEVYFRRADYTYDYNIDDQGLNYIGATLNYRISRTWQLSFSGELSQADVENNYRFYTRLTKRFYSKKKK